MEDSRRNLEINLRANIFSPSVVNPNEGKVSVRIYYDSYDQYHSEKDVAIIKSSVQGMLQKVSGLKEIKRIVNQCSTVFTEIGGRGILYFLSHAIVDQIVKKIDYFDSLHDEHTAIAAERLRLALPVIREEVKILEQKLLREIGEVPREGVSRAPKLERLLRLLRDSFSEHASDRDYRGMIFVQATALVSTLAREINDFFKDRWWRCGGNLQGAEPRTKPGKKKILMAFEAGIFAFLYQPRLEQKAWTFRIANSLLCFQQTKLQRVKYNKQAEQDILTPSITTLRTIRLWRSSRRGG